ncbi:MAG: oligosaccharide flippase family protein [bacterium]|nr:oligosaccharide flippase family protein [bacterium]
MLKTIFKNLSIYAIVPIVTGIVSFLLLPIKSRYLLPLDYGIIGLLTTVGGIITVFSTLQLNSGFMRIYHDLKSKKQKREYTTSLFIFTIFLGIIAVFLIGCLLFFFSHIIFPSKVISFFPYIAVQLIIVYLIQFNLIPDSLMVTEQKAKLRSTNRLLNFIISTCCSLYFIVYLNLKAEGILYGICLGHLFSSIFYLVFISKYLNFSLSLKSIVYIKKTIKYSVPFISACLCAYLYTYSDKYILSIMLNLHDVGIYTFAQNLILPLSFVLGALDASFLPEYYKSKKKNINNDILKRTNEVLFVALGALVVFWTGFIKTIYFLIDSSYLQSFSIVWFLILFWFFRYLYIFPTAIILFYKKTRYIPFLHFVPAVVNIGFNIVLIKYLGIYGALISTIICAIITLILSHYFAYKLDKKSFDYKYLAGFCCIIVIFVFFMHYLQYSKFLYNLLVKMCLFGLYLLVSIKYYALDFKRYINKIMFFLKIAKYKI